MERFAKKFRVTASICILLELAAAFLPFLKRVQENYPDVTWNQLNYIQGAFTALTKGTEQKLPEVLTSGQAVWVLIFMLLPLLIAVAAGVWGMVGDHTQKVSLLLVFVVFVLDIVLLAMGGQLKAEAGDGQTYLQAYGGIVSLVISGVASLISIAAWIATPKTMKESAVSIPEVHEIKQQQIEAKYNVMLDQQAPQSSTQTQATAPQQMPPHGVLVGLKGMYEGAQIPLTDGEEILLGRAEGNHLIFTGQKSVSRRHCKLKWVAAKQKYIIHDYSSSGTYLNGLDDCLPQNLDMELPCGTQIALGTRDNIFLLK